MGEADLLQRQSQVNKESTGGKKQILRETKELTESLTLQYVFGKGVSVLITAPESWKKDTSIK